MVDRNKELAINTVILGIGQLIPKFLAIVLLPLLTSYLTTEEYGNYDLILSIASLLIPVVTMQIQQAVFRYLLASKSDENKTLYVTGSLVYIGISSVVCYPIDFETIQNRFIIGSFDLFAFFKRSSLFTFGANRSWFRIQCQIFCKCCGLFSSQSCCNCRYADGVSFGASRGDYISNNRLLEFRSLYGTRIWYASLF